MIFNILIFLISSFLFFYFSTKSFEPILNIQETWAWDKKEFAGLRNDSRFAFKPTQILNGYKTEKGVYFFNGGEFAIQENQLSELPVLGKGHFLYKKIGSTLLYYSAKGELLWEKNFKSYPRTSPKGKLVLLTAGDGNQVLIANQNGDLIGIERVDGKFLTDISFSYNDDVVFILFSGGENYKIDKNGKLISEKTYSFKNETVFFKSSAISPNSNSVAIHSFRNNKDLIEVIGEKNIVQYSVNLDSVYAHRIYMALNDKKELLINLPNRVLFYNQNGKKLFDKKKPNQEGIYQIAFANNSFFAYNLNGILFFTNENGDIYKEKKIPSDSRLIQSENWNLLFLDTPKEIYSLQILE
jgi:hypothetical protein